LNVEQDRTRLAGFEGGSSVLQTCRQRDIIALGI
jgi:hypothetical protein